MRMVRVWVVVVFFWGFEVVVVGRMVRMVRMVMVFFVFFFDVDDEFGFEVVVEGMFVVMSFEVVFVSDSIGIVFIRVFYMFEYVYVFVGVGGVFVMSGREYIVFGGDDGSGIGVGEDGGGDESGRMYFDGVFWKEMR